MVSEGTDNELQERQEAKEKEKKKCVPREKKDRYYSTEIAFVVLKIGKLLCTIQSVPGVKVLSIFKTKADIRNYLSQHLPLCLHCYTLKEKKKKKKCPETLDGLSKGTNELVARPRLESRSYDSKSTPCPELT